MIPYGVYDLASNEGWVSVGITHDTARFAVASIRRWWTEMGAGRCPRARKLMITADGGGSNSSRSRLWKVALQELADEIGLPLHVCHFPPGTSKPPGAPWRMEQDRASPVQFHHPELARQVARSAVAGRWSAIRRS